MSFTQFRAGIAPALLSVLLLSSPAAFAAGSHAGGHGRVDAAIGQPGQPAAASRTVQVEMHDTYFEPETIRVAPGETVRFVVSNRGQLVHEFNIGTPAMHAEHQDEMQMMVEHGVLEADEINHEMMGRDMGGGHVMSHDHANSVLLEPGRTGEVVWTFPQQADADIEYACNVPGHYQAGMVGEFRIGN